MKSRPASEAIKFGIDIEIEKYIRQKRGLGNNTNLHQLSQGPNLTKSSQTEDKNKYKNNSEEEVCLTCSA